MLVVKLLAVLIFIIIMLQRKAKMWIIMASAAIIVAILFGLSAEETAGVTFTTLTSGDTIRTAMLLILVMYVERVMSQRALMSKMVVSLKNLVNDYRIASMILPALIGVLPSVGGAVFSAPMIEEVCDGTNVTAEDKCFVNYWYRHVAEYVMPIYTAIILTSSILGVKMNVLVRRFYPYTVLNIIVGMFFIFYFFPKMTVSKSKEMKKNLIDFLYASYPISMMLILFFVFKLDIVYALAVTLLVLLLTGRFGPERVWSSIIKSVSYDSVFSIIGILYFKNMLVSSTAINQLPELFSRMGINNVWVAFLLPLAVAVLTGVNNAAVVITLPIIMNLGGALDMGLVTIAFVACNVGLLISPMHMCFILTNDYFKSSFMKVWLRVAIGQSIVMLASVIAYIVKI